MPSSSLSKLPSWVNVKIKEYARRPLRQVSFSDMLKFGPNPSREHVLNAAIFLSDELPVRMAHRFQAIEALPKSILMPRDGTASSTTLPQDLKRIQMWYAKSFQELVEFGQDVERWRRNPDAVRLGPNAASMASSSMFMQGYGSSGSAFSPAGISSWFGSNSNSSNPNTFKSRISSWLSPTSSNQLHTLLHGASASTSSASATLDAVMGLGGALNHESSSPELAAATAKAAAVRLQKMEPETVVDHTSLQYYGKTLEPHVAAVASHYNSRFESLLTNIVERHNPIIVLLAKNIRDLAMAGHIDITSHLTQTFINKFFRARTGMRMLIGHHIALSKKKYRHQDNVGIVCTKTNAAEVAEEAAMDAAEVCERSYGVTPEVDIRIGAGVHKLLDDFVFVPSHLHHVLFEIIKNALRAVVEKRELVVGPGNADRDDLEPVRVYIEQENEGETILIRVSDRGTGIKSGDVPKLFRYAYTTAKPAQLDSNQFHGSEVEGAPMAGFGYGLPLSRLYARYFNGDLNITSKWGYGTDVYLTLHRSLDGIMEPYM
ncbi:[Pyruvate dehydrogenase (acetyl-transferring)] kinase isozyme 4 [Phlyctochytrium planicorne]|nr:[Pyruvate dehydrogenase (acetyl-transferring)] kinase isozyme 4 [Phlyctochytrium planicorne]